MSFGNCIQCYTNVTLAITRKVYAGHDTAPSSPSPTASPVNALSARTFGTWTVLSSIIRFYAAYHIDDPMVYQLALWSFVLAGAHFGSEWLYYGTARWGRGLAGPVIVCVVSLPWMLSSWEWYVR